MLLTNVIVQYYNANSQDRQQEINLVLKHNCNNKYINKIYLLSESANIDLNFLTEKELKKIEINNINKRLSYSDAFNFYNKNLSNTICILTNADIYFDNSLEILDSINFNKLILCQTRYEHEFNRKYNILYGLEIKGNKSSECTYSQDTWIFKMEKIDVINSDIMLGFSGCDNLIVKNFINSGYNVVNSSRYLCCNHFDHLSKNEDGSKGRVSNLNKRLGIKEDYYFLHSGLNVIDKFCTNIQNIVENNHVSIKYDSEIISLSNIIDNESQFTVSSYIKKPYICHLTNNIIWEPLEDDFEKQITIRFATCLNIECIDFSCKQYKQNNSQDEFGYIKSIKLSYSVNGTHWIKISNSISCNDVNNYDYIKRVYMPYRLYCCSLRIQICDYYVKPNLICNIYANKNGNIKLLDTNNCKFKKFIINGMINTTYRDTLSFNNFHLSDCDKQYKTSKIYDEYINWDNPEKINFVDSMMYYEFFRINQIDKKLFLSEYSKYFFNNNFKITKSILNEPIKEGICIMLCIMNRKKNLELYFKSWLNKDINQIIILDWSSNDDNYYNIINKINDPRILYIRVNNEKTFIRTFAQNLAASFCKYDKLLKLDSDVTITDDFFQKNILEKNTFIAGNFLCARDMNEEYTHGNIYLYLDDYFRVGGYCEFIKTYGNDDLDLPFRLQVINGLKERMINLDTLYHNPHDNKSRVVNLSGIKIPHEEMQYNKTNMDKLPLWNRFFKLQKYNIVKKLNNYYECDRILDFEYSYSSIIT